MKRITSILIPSILLLLLAAYASAQTSTASLSGVIIDSNGAVIPGATVSVSDPSNGLRREVTTNDSGSFTVSFLPPGTYSLVVRREGFTQVEVPDVVLNVGDQRAIRVDLKVGDVKAQIDVRPEETLIDTNPGVSTAINRDFVGSLPTNGRSLQTLILLSPGVVNTPAATSPGQFSVNGNRSNANNFTVDGISGNFSATYLGIGQQGSGTVPATTQQGSFSSLASLDAIQEFSIQTSTFAPEFGRQPGGQISIVTRGGENAFRGSLFEYFRNDALDANNFFNNANRLDRPSLRYNNFGGNFSGPVVLPWFGDGGPGVWKGTDKTFFFFSYEGQRFLLPQPPTTITVPSLTARQNATSAIAQAVLNSFPIPNGPIVLDSGGNPTGALFTTSVSNQSDSDTYGVRIDHRFTNDFTLFGRVNISNTKQDARNANNPAVNQRSFADSKTFTLGSNQIFGSKLLNDIRANWSKQESGGHYLSPDNRIHDGFGGGIPFSADLILPSGIPMNANVYSLDPFFLTTFGNEGAVNNPGTNEQLQVIDNLSYMVGTHQLKFGGDYRILRPKVAAGGVKALILFPSVTAMNTNTTLFTAFTSVPDYESKIESYGFYGQDTWKINKRTSMTFGVRWEINPSPRGSGDVVPLTLAAPPNLSNLDQTSLQLAPAGTPYYETDFANFAPRFGISYLINDKSGRELVIRGGIGVFYDLGQTGFGDAGFPYARSRQVFGQTVPLAAADVAFPPLNFTPSASNRARVTAASPDYTLPRTYQWNLTAEQSIGKDQSVSVAYVASLGRKLVNARSINIGLPGQVPNAYFSTNFASVTYVENGAESDYHSLQAQFTKRLSKGMQLLGNYTWSHAIDTASSEGNISAPGFIFPMSINRGNSSFDVRHNFTTALTYNIPTPNLGAFGNAILRNWSLNGIFVARTGLPYDVSITEPDPLLGTASYRRPNLTGQPIYLDDTSVASGRRLNSAAFNFILPAGQMGNLGRNSLRGPGFWQLDLGLHRTFKFSERVSVQLRGEAFNIFNHANFLYPSNTSGTRNANGTVTINPNFGIITSTASNASSSSIYNTGFNPLFQNGGPRSLQFAARLSF